MIYFQSNSNAECYLSKEQKKNKKRYYKQRSTLKEKHLKDYTKP